MYISISIIITDNHTVYGVVKEEQWTQCLHAKKVNVNICLGITQAGLKMNKRMINSQLVPYSDLIQTANCEHHYMPSRTRSCKLGDDSTKKRPRPRFALLSFIIICICPLSDSLWCRLCRTKASVEVLSSVHDYNIVLTSVSAQDVVRRTPPYLSHSK